MKLAILDGILDSPEWSPDGKSIVYGTNPTYPDTMWYSTNHVAIAAADGVVCVSLGGSAFDTVLHVRGGDCAAESELACNDDSRDIAGGRACCRPAWA